MSLTSIARKASKTLVLPLGSPARRRPDDVVILLYHRVGSEPSEIELPADGFERQLAWLVANETVVSLDQALEGRGGVVVTFDDGTRDFYETVLPVLVRYGVPATLYVATSRIGDGGLRWSHLRDCVGSSLVSVGSHTHTHLNLARASEMEAEDEMRRSKGLIEDRLSVACRHFAYPWAVAGEPADRAARKLFDSAALEAWRTNRAGRTDPHRLGRVPVLRSDGGFFFRRKARGELDGERWFYRALGRGPWGEA